jgi:hypothetical protein
LCRPDVTDGELFIELGPPKSISIALSKRRRTLGQGREVIGGI